VTAALQGTTPVYGPEMAELEDRVVLALQRLHVENGGYLRTVELYNGELDTDDTAADFFRSCLAGSPAIFVACSGASYQRSGRAYREDLGLVLLLASQHVRSRLAQVRGDIAAGADVGDPEALPTSDPGIYTMKRDARRELVGQTWLDGMGGLVIKREAIVLHQPALTLWQMEFEAEYRYVPERKSPATATATELELRHNLEGPADADLGNPTIRQERTL
jgi:phage gp37-like protein